LGFDGHPSTIYLRASTDQMDAVRGVVAPTADPQAPYQVTVSRPSDALIARAQAKRALNGLFLALGGVSLLVGAIGVANTMIISVLERRTEIGLRRALGATRGNIRTQFLFEAMLLAVGGGATGVLAGAATTIGYARSRHWSSEVPITAWVGGLIAAALIGCIAGLLPAVRAARLQPTEALWRV
jgi:putative ABC transport system permease protein